MDVIEYSGDADIVRIDETGSNTGVFESSDGDDDSEISVKVAPVMATPSP